MAAAVMCIGVTFTVAKLVGNAVGQHVVKVDPFVVENPNAAHYFAAKPPAHQLVVSMAAVLMVAVCLLFQLLLQLPLMVGPIGMKTFALLKRALL